jgi:hypothetical protein
MYSLGYSDPVSSDLAARSMPYEVGQLYRVRMGKEVMEHYTETKSVAIDLV